MKFKLLLLAFFGVSALFASPSVSSVGNKAPKISAKNLEGENFKLSSIKDKVIIVRFWKKGCHKCQSELYKLQKLEDTYPNSLAVVTINSDDSIKDIEDFKKEYNVNYILLKDDMDITKKRYGVATFPTTFVISKDGVVLEKVLGKDAWEQFEEKVLEYL